MKIIQLCIPVTKSRDVMRALAVMLAILIATPVTLAAFFQDSVQMTVALAGVPVVMLIVALVIVMRHRSNVKCLVSTLKENAYQDWSRLCEVEPSKSYFRSVAASARAFAEAVHLVAHGGVAVQVFRDVQDPGRAVPVPIYCEEQVELTEENPAFIEAAAEAGLSPDRSARRKRIILFFACIACAAPLIGACNAWQHGADLFWPCTLGTLVAAVIVPPLLTLKMGSMRYFVQTGRIVSSYSRATRRSEREYRPGLSTAVWWIDRGELILAAGGEGEHIKVPRICQEFAFRCFLGGRLPADGDHYVDSHVP